MKCAEDDKKQMTCLNVLVVLDLTMRCNLNSGSAEDELSLTLFYTQWWIAKPLPSSSTGGTSPIGKCYNCTCISNCVNKLGACLTTVYCKSFEVEIVRGGKVLWL